MAMKLRLTTNAPHYKGRLMVECSTKDSTERTKRHYIPVEGLVNPIFDKSHWNEKRGKFTNYPNASGNNQVISSLLDSLNSILETCNVKDGKHLKSLYEKGMTISAKKTLTLGEYIALLVEGMKKEGKSSNVELYNTLHNVLNGECKKLIRTSKNVTTFKPAKYNGIRLYDTSLCDIANIHFKIFGKWIISERNGANYKNLMTTFKAVANKAKQEYDYPIHLDYQWRKDMPKMNLQALTAEQRYNKKQQDVPALTEREIKAVEGLDVSSLVRNGNKRNIKLAELYKNFALLMYYTKSRPADVLSWTEKHNYLEKDGKKMIIYTPHKLRNRVERHVTVTLNEKAVRIIERYKGQSKGGYLLPLPMNETSWDITSDFHKWDIRKKNTESRLNAFLKKVATALRLNVQQLTLYTLRHSAITHAINSKASAFLVAKEAGTSVKMIERHYYNDTI